VADRRARRAARLRPARFDDLGVRRALAGWLLPVLVGAMTFLAALACAGFVAAASIGRHWQADAGTALTIQVPHPGDPAPAGHGTRRDAVLGIVQAAGGIAAAHALTDAELSDLLRPWLGAGAEALALPLPAVIAVRLTADGADPDRLAARLDAAAPGTLVERHDVWVRRLAALARSLQACAGLALLVVAAVAALVIAVATRVGLAARRQAIEIVHDLGAADGYIAGRFARRATRLAFTGAAAGAAGSVPVLLRLAALAAPFGAGDTAAPLPESGGFGLDGLQSLPLSMWVALTALPLAAGLIGWMAAQVTVRRWLRRLP
jgi:cell division transport system permease protein